MNVLHSFTIVFLCALSPAFLLFCVVVGPFLAWGLSPAHRSEVLRDLQADILLLGCHLRLQRASNGSIYRFACRRKHKSRFDVLFLPLCWGKSDMDRAVFPMFRSDLLNQARRLLSRPYSDALPYLISHSIFQQISPSAECFFD